MTAEAPSIDSRSRRDTLLLLGIAAAVALAHLLTNNRYGFHRDELQVLSDARHLDGGFVPYAPFTPFVEGSGLSLFGLSMAGLRVVCVVAEGWGVAVTRLLGRECGGGRWGQGRG